MDTRRAKNFVRWSYSDPNIDPWSPRNMPNPDFPAHVQLPPPGANTSRYPELIRYILTTRAATARQYCKSVPGSAETHAPCR